MKVASLLPAPCTPYSCDCMRYGCFSACYSELFHITSAIPTSGREGLTWQLNVCFHHVSYELGQAFFGRSVLSTVTGKQCYLGCLPPYHSSACVWKREQSNLPRTCKSASGKDKKNKDWSCWKLSIRQGSGKNHWQNGEELKNQDEHCRGNEMRGTFSLTLTDTWETRYWKLPNNRRSATLGTTSLCSHTQKEIILWF